METDVAELQVEVALLPASSSTRKGSFSSGYRPNHKHPRTGEYFMGEFTIDDDSSVVPGGIARAHLRILATPEQIETLRAFGSWTIWEGPRHVGSVRILGSHEL
jgi:hypothetical protein